MAELRSAWALMVEDPAFIEEARKAGLLIKSQSASELEEVVLKAARLSPKTLDRTAALLEWKR